MPVKIYRRKGSKVWQYRGTVAGNRLRGTTGAESKPVAARIASKIETKEWERHLDGPTDTLIFPQAVALYLKAGKSEQYVWKIEDYWKNTKVKDMTAGGIRQSAIELYPGVTAATWNRCAIVPTQAIINHCAEMELCPRIRVRRFKEDEKIRHPVTREWLDAFCAKAAPDQQQIALALFMFSTGCRISEARRAEWEDIDFQARTILIRKTKIRRERLPNMPPRLLVALAKLPRDSKPFGTSYTTLRDRWERIRVAAGLKRLTFHCSRHGFATTLIHDGVDVVTVAKLGGWASVQQVLKTYGHAKDDPRITDGLFDTDLTHPAERTKQNQ